MTSLYDTDFHAWCLQQSLFLKQLAPHLKACGKLAEHLNIYELSEEVEDMGNEKLNSLKSHLINLFCHLLKWQYQTEKRTDSWLNTIGNARLQIERLLEENPSLGAKIEGLFGAAFKYAIKSAALETGLPKDTFPKDNPFPYPDFLSEGWLP